MGCFDVFKQHKRLKTQFEKKITTSFALTTYSETNAIKLKASQPLKHL